MVSNADNVRISTEDYIMNYLPGLWYSEETSELFDALSKAQGEFKEAEFDRSGNWGKYATLQSLRNATQEALTKYGLAVKQDPVSVDGKYFIYTTLGHKSGQKSISCMELRVAGPDMQKLGAAITYGKRYAYSSILGIYAEEDDDGDSNAKSFEKKENMNQRSFTNNLGNGEPTDQQLKSVNWIKETKKELYDEIIAELHIDDNNLTKTTASQIIGAAKERYNKDKQ